MSMVPSSRMFIDHHGPVTVRLVRPAWAFLYTWDAAVRKYAAVRALRWHARHLPRVKSEICPRCRLTGHHVSDCDVDMTV